MLASIIPRFAHTLEQNPETRKITDFFTFYSLPLASTVINNTKHPLLQTAYLYYYATETAFKKDVDSWRAVS
jgi:glycylpeptide N-tetradecanoyltransferase